MTQIESIARILAYEYEGSEDNWQRYEAVARNILNNMTNEKTNPT